MSEWRRVVVTGLGAVTPVGNNVSETWNSLKNGKNGIAPITFFDTEGFKAKLAAEVKGFEPKEYLEVNEILRTDRYAQLAVAAAAQAVEDSGIEGKVEPEKFGVMFGTGIGGIGTFEVEHTKLLEKGPRRVSSLFIPMMIGNMAAGTVAMRTGFKGDNFCTTTACSSATHAIGEAFRKIKDGYLDAALCGGTGACISRFALSGFNNMHALSRATELDKASTPFDLNRQGFVLGEGSGMLVLEELEHAKARGANIYAEVIGYGATCDAYHETSPDPEGKGGAKAMEFAVKESGRAPETFNYVNAHGTSTPMNDKTETAAVKLVFGEHAKNMVINSTKSMTGHLLGAAGGVEAVACALQIKNSKVHRTLGLKVADPECDLDYAADGTRDMKITGALSNSLGFGGHNACIAFAPVED